MPAGFSLCKIDSELNRFEPLHLLLFEWNIYIQEVRGIWRHIKRIFTLEWLPSKKECVSLLFCLHCEHIYCMKAVPKYLIKFTGKHVCRSVFKIKVILTICQLCGFCEIFQISFFQNTSWRLHQYANSKAWVESQVWVYQKSIFLTS